MATAPGTLSIAPAASGATQSDALPIKVAGLLGIALERIHFVSVAQRSCTEIESERLRNALLSALSHDLSTPLTVIAGLAGTVGLTPPALSPSRPKCSAQSASRHCVLARWCTSGSQTTA